MRQMGKNFSRVMSVFLSFIMFITVINFTTIKANADGSAGTLDDFIERCYTVTLDRPSDAEGFAYWKGRVLNGEAVGIEVAYGFLFSKEYTQKDKTNTEYVRDLYTLFMGRDPDDSGFNDWMNKLDEGVSRLDVFVGFANSQEFYNICESYGITAGRYVKGYDRNTINNVNLYVERLYKICLGRIGDKGGQTNWAEKLMKKEISGSECARSFIFSKEYTNLGLSDEEFVENLYLAMFGRPSDCDGKNNWIYGLKNGMTRDEVFAGFANSVEFDNICKAYGINRGTYTATNKGTFNKDNPNNEEITFEHSWDKGTVTKKATLTEKGVKTYKCSQCNETKTEEIPCLLAGAKAGDIIKYGKYEQDNDTSNGKEEIEWLVLKKDGDKVFVTSKYVLDSKPIDPTASYYSTDIKWENCFLRGWLNDDFYNSAFSDKEKSNILLTTVENKDNPYFGTPAGNDTKDYVFCLSLEEMETYFGEYTWRDLANGNRYGANQNLICRYTPYAFEQSGTTDSVITEADYENQFKEYGYTRDIIGLTLRGDWWLRTPENGSYFLDVDDRGIAGEGTGTFMIHNRGIRPAMYLKYEK